MAALFAELEAAANANLLTTAGELGAALDALGFRVAAGDACIDVVDVQNMNDSDICFQRGDRER